MRIDSDSDDGQALQPARDIGGLTVNTVVAALEDVGKCGQPLTHLPELAKLSETLTVFRSELDRSSANRLIMDV